MSHEKSRLIDDLLIFHSCLNLSPHRAYPQIKMENHGFCAPIWLFFPMKCIKSPIESLCFIHKPCLKTHDFHSEIQSDINPMKPMRSR